MTRAIQSPNWSRSRIIFELRENGTSAAALATQQSLSRSTFYSAMERPYPRIHDLIASALGRKRQDIWPTFYGDDGKRLSRREQIKREFQRTAA